METAPKPIPVEARASVSAAKIAYFEGDFERCLEICANIHLGTLATTSEVALLKARAYLRTGRHSEAEAVIATTWDTHTTLDASLTAEMLVATARIRQNDPDTGIGMLVSATARSSSAHFAIRSEIAFCTALGHWVKRELEAAESYLALVDPRSDIIHARALELQSFCHAARGDYQRSAEYFRLTLLRLDDCKAQDRAIVATAISTLAIYAAELFDRDIAHFVEARAQRINWSSGVGEHRFSTLLHLALFNEIAGNTREAYHFAMLAREAAPTLAFEVFGWGISSKIALNAGEPVFAFTCVKRAQKLLDGLDLHELTGEDRFSILTVAESTAHFDPEKAAELFACYRSLVPADKMLALSDDPRLVADETFVEGVIACARKDTDRAQACFRDAFEKFKELAYVSRALAAAHALLGLAEDDGLRRYIGTHLAGTTNYITTSRIGPVDDRIDAIERHPVFASLTRSQQDVVVLICMGKTNKTIAQRRGVGTQTIKNVLTKTVFPAFGVSSRAELMSAVLAGHQR